MKLFVRTYAVKPQCTNQVRVRFGGTLYTLYRVVRVFGLTIYRRTILDDLTYDHAVAHCTALHVGISEARVLHAHELALAREREAADRPDD